MSIYNITDKDIVDRFVDKAVKAEDKEWAHPILLNYMQNGIVPDDEKARIVIHFFDKEYDWLKQFRLQRIALHPNSCTL